MTFDAGTQRSVETCAIAFFVGDTRSADFTIALSDDGPATGNSTIAHPRTVRGWAIVLFRLTT